jgi:hypothetical protein
MDIGGQVIEIRYDSDAKKWIVDPGEVHAAPGQTVTWKAIGTRAQIWFPQTGFMTPASAIIQAEQEESLTVAPDAGEGTRPYAVYCEADNLFVYKSDGSEPVVIVP